MYRGMTARARGGDGLDLQAVLTYAYAVQCLRARQKQALDRLASHTLQAVSGANIAIGTVDRDELRWMVSAAADGGAARSELYLPNELPDVYCPSDDEGETAGADRQYPVHVVQNGGSHAPSAYVFITKAGHLLGVLAINRSVGDNFNEHDVRMLRIFAMSVDHVLGWTPTHPRPEGLDEIAARQKKFEFETMREKSVDAIEVLPDPEPEPEAVLELPEIEFPGMFNTEPQKSSGLGLKIAVAAAVLILLVVGFNAMRYTARKGSAGAAAPAVAETKAVTSAKAAVAAAPADGVKIENPDASFTWEPAMVSGVPVSLNQVRIRRQNQQVFVIFELSGDAGVKVEQKSSPEQVVVRFKGTKMPPKLSVRGSDPMITSFTARAKGNDAELVFKMNKHVGVLLVGPTAEHHVIVNLIG